MIGSHKYSVFSKVFGGQQTEVKNAYISYLLIGAFASSISSFISFNTFQNVTLSRYLLNAYLL